MAIRSDFAAIILSNGRPDRVITYDTLKRSGYTGRIILLVDDLDETRGEYIERYGDQVYVFDKRAVGKTFDRGDNFDNLRSTNYARNVSFDVARELGVKYFIQLDDDYRHFQFRFDRDFRYRPKVCKDLDAVFSAMLRFYENTPALTSIAISQGGDFIGGEDCGNADSISAKRKAMNSFLCSVDRRFTFIGRLNEDVNTYTRPASTGALFLTTNQVSLEQIQTQANAGGMTEAYLEGGTYVKSFYTVMFQPSSVKVGILRDRSRSRIHHSIDWKRTTPMILSESYKKV